MNCADPIHDLTSLGYTAREAAFLYLVCKVSGYFTRSQFNNFVRRESGGMEQQLIRKLAQNGHVQELQGSNRKRIYHITSRELYRVAGYQDSTSRRLKADEEIARRLIILQWSIRNASSVILYSDEEKVSFFRHEAGLPDQLLPWVGSVHRGVRECESLLRLPIYVHDSREDSQLVTFLFADPGFATHRPFERYLRLVSPICLELKAFQIVYATSRTSSVAKARSVFEKAFALKNTEEAPQMFPKGIGHFLRFVDAERRWKASAANLTTEDARLVNEGELLYNSPAYSRLKEASARGEQLESRLAEMGIRSLAHGQFFSHIIELPRMVDRFDRGQSVRVPQLEMTLGA